MKNKDLPASIFIITVLCLSVLFTAAGAAANNQIVLALQQATPLFAAIFICVLYSKSKLFKSAGINHIGKMRYYIAALLIPTVTLFISYFAGWSFELVKFYWQTQAATFELGIAAQFAKVFILNDIMYLISFPIVALWAFGEEIGWRGFLQPRLIKKFGVKRGIVITGLVWALWHYPLILSGNYYESGNTVINTALFTITVILMSVSMGYLTYKSNSVWPAVVFHTKSNLTWQLCGMLFTSNSNKSIYVCGEAGVVNIAVWGIFALIILRRIFISTKKEKAA